MLLRAAQAGVTRTIAIGGNPGANELAVSIARAHPNHVRAVVGFDRDQVKENPSRDALAALAADPVVVGIGETGLDYHYDPETALEQQELLGSMLALARNRVLPVVLHNRDSDADMMRMLREHAAHWTGPRDRIGVLHCYTGGIEMAEQLIELGFHISFSGIVTFRNADSLRKVVPIVPAERLLVETDAPFLAPVPMRGKTNEPAYVRHVVELLAHLRNTTFEEMAELTTRNAARLFNWPV